jgi:hypothetical protein
MSDRQHQYVFLGFIDSIDDPPIADAISKQSGQVARQAFDVVMPTRLALQLSKAAGELLG